MSSSTLQTVDLKRSFSEVVWKTLFLSVLPLSRALLLDAVELLIAPLPLILLRFLILKGSSSPQCLPPLRS